MITESNLRELLLSLGFTCTGDVYTKAFNHIDGDNKMVANFKTKTLSYPSELRGKDRNKGFDKPENFVVFECVNRLLEKGYRPEDIELERAWHLGHTAKGGFADICVSDTDGSILFIIECKTWGKEFEKARKDTENDGAQLFSYWQQEQSCKWLVLYASNFINGSVEYKALTIDCSDDANFELLAEKDKTIKLYRNAHTTSERYEVWKDTYGKVFQGDLVFSADSVAYKIGVKPLLKKNLRDFEPDDKIVNKFEEILRHNNVSDKENAFNRLIALFICKLEDESTKGEDDEVDFQYKQGTDTYETLLDRLLLLHRKGMEKFMCEEYAYVDANYPERLFALCGGETRKKAIEDLQGKIRILKLISNNDFTFIDVHNEDLFYKNGRILVEMVRLFEDYRIVYPSKHQFLGDLFEQLLNKGFKQNEGQFFTPMPITRFIWDSLPVDRMMKSERGTVYPKVIDYACGAGHFLTEAIEAINHFAENNDNSWVRDHIFGIEKDYRLARVAKISLFMNGAGEGNIIFGDGLENTPDKGIANGQFDILVANPPYSVKDFKQHLQLKNNSFELLDSISLNGSEIETLFIERISQLLRPQGIAAVILPSSILSNDSASYTGAREQILRNFYIRAIVAFGSKTFGATGTNTVVLFLEKFDEPPKPMDMVADSVEAILNGKDLTEWKDKEILDMYVAQIEQDMDTYHAFLSNKLSLDDLRDNEYFKMYCSAFDKSEKAKNLVKTKAYKALSEEKQNEKYLEQLYAYIRNIESEKLYYFGLVYNQKTVIIKAPAANNEQKKFLGYDWSNRKGNEGIQIITPGGKMYDDKDREKEGTLAHAIRQSFNNVVPHFTGEQADFGSMVNTKDMLDYSRGAFNKAIGINVDAVIKNTSKYSAIKLNECVEVTSGLWTGEKEPLKKVKVIRNTNFTMEGKLNLIDVAEIDVEESSLKTRTLERGDIILEKSGGSQTQAVGRVVIFDIDGEFSYSNFTARLRVNNSLILAKYLYLLLNDYYQHKKTFGYQNGMGGLKNLDMDRYLDIPVPVPPIDIQNKIISECEQIDEKYNSTRMDIEDYRQEVEDLFNELDAISNGGYKLSLANTEKFMVSIGQRVLNNELVEKGKVPVYSANVLEPFGYVDKLLITDFSFDSVLWGIDGDWAVNFMPKDTQFYPTDHCGVLRCMTPEVNPHYLSHILEREGKKAGFSRSYRASIDRIKGISFTVPDRVTQDAIIAKIMECQNKISNAQTKLESLQGKTANILDKYLR